ncbi:hypothetical protein [Nocardia testacea]|uniref:hypothetical protein n=1 Tax=Nocardia testacea TaxID=248551 RepID=UPI003A85A14B
MIAAATVSRDGVRAELLTLAAGREAAAGRRLVLIVDGLEEDTGTPPIVGLLPNRPHENLRIIVASRHGPELPIPQRHPLAGVAPYSLTPSPFAADIRDRAITELDTLLHGPAEHRELVALITAANGLTGTELTELTGMAPFEIDTLLRRAAGRSFRASPIPFSLDGATDEVYALAHETLQRTAEQRLGPHHLNTSMDRLHAWADYYREQTWPEQTPDFLLRRYFAVLDQHRDQPRMATLALDTFRHDRIRARTGGDATALAEIRTVQQRICDQPDPDLLNTARLARHRDSLHHRNTEIPIALPALWARLGQPDRAENLAQGLPALSDQSNALASIAAALATMEPERALQLAARAETFARTITDPESQALALANIAVSLVTVDSERALQLAERALQLNERAEILTAHAELTGHADTATGRWERAWALISIAEVLVSTSPEHALQVIECAETLVDTIAAWEYAYALRAIASALAAVDADRAEALVDTIADPAEHVSALIGIATELTTVDPDHAIQLIERARILSYSINDPGPRASVLTEIAEVLADVDPERAIEFAHTIADPADQAAALTAIATKLATGEPDRAMEVIESAKTLVDTIADPAFQDSALVRNRQGAGHCGLRPAEHLARSITDPEQQVFAFLNISDAIAESLVRSRLPIQHAGSESLISTAPTPVPTSTLHVRSKRLLALTWSVAPWALPVAVLATVDSTALHVFASEMLSPPPT